MKVSAPPAEALAIDSLDALQSQDYRQLLAVIDSLRSRGFGSILQLPQLVVSSGQSSGKSSVLEAITEERPETENDQLHTFMETITDFSELPRLMDKATEAMGLDNETINARGTKAFTRDVLSIEISGPDSLELTLINLPGLIQTATNELTQEDVTFITSSQATTSNDYGHQGIIDKCRKADSQGERTLGIVTKPNYLRAESKNEATWIELVQNKNNYFALGWHILKNRSEDEMMARRHYPSHAPFELPYKHLKRELLKLQTELYEKYASTLKALADLGERRSTYVEQKRFQIGTSMAYQAVVQAASDGHYEHPFFGNINTEQGFEDAMDMRRLRATVQHLNHEFASQVRQYGSKYRIWSMDETSGTNSKDDRKEPPLSEVYAAARSSQKVLTRDAAVRWVKELPEQSENWQSLVQAQIDRIDALCTTFVSAAINQVAAEDVAKRLSECKLGAALAQRFQGAQQELARLIADKQCQPMTYNPAYGSSVKEACYRKATARMQAMMEQAEINVEDEDGNERLMLNPDILKHAIKEIADPEMERAIAEDALESQLAYYKDKAKYFIAAVTEHVIERHLLHDLATHTLSPARIAEMSEGEVVVFAVELESVTRRREHLDAQKTILESGQEAFRRALVAFRC